VKILALSTSTGRGSVAIVGAPGEGAATSYVDLQGHAERLFHAIDQVLAEAGVTRSALEGIACDVGPGSFTGVRVAVASMKGIALGLGLPIAGVGSLEAMAAAAFGEGLAGPGDLVVAAVDAKKSELFVAAYDASGHAVVAPSARAAGPEALAIVEAPAGGRIVVVGEIAASIPLPAGAVLARGDAVDLPDARWIGRLAAPRLMPLEADTVEPLYVRPPDAVPAKPPASA